MYQSQDSRRKYGEYNSKDAPMYATGLKHSQISKKTKAKVAQFKKKTLIQFSRDSKGYSSPKGKRYAY